MARATRTKKVDTFSPNDIFRELASNVKKQAVTPNLYAYKPHAKQLRFHKSTKKVRLYIGGNRSGKTVGGICEGIWWSRGVHPYRKIPEPPNAGRVHTVDLINGLSKIILPAYGRWCPPSLLKNGSWEDSYDKQERVLTFENSSFIEFMSYEMDLDKFAGTSRDWNHFDEEPPQSIYNESQARLIDTDGDAWLTMTPLDGMTWIYDALFLPGTEADDPNIEVIQVDMAENPHLKESARVRYLQTLDDDERKAREHGSFVQLGGRVYKHFDKNIHVVPSFIPPKDWEWYASMDHGFNSPTAWLWHAVSPSGEVVTFSEHYQNELTVKEHAEIVKARNVTLGKEPNIYVGDPAIAQRTAVTGTSIQQEYMDNGLPIALATTRDVLTGINRISTYLRFGEDNKPRYTITEDCVNYIREMGRLRWKTYASKKMQHDNNAQEQVHKKDDHACDSARYFFTFMPDLTPDEIAKPARAVREPGAKYDELLSKMVDRADWNGPPSPPEWYTTEMYESLVDD